MSRTIHLSLSLEGALRNKDLAWFVRDDGSRPKNREVIEWIKYQIAMGRKLWPMSDKCEGFSYEKGCPGHDESESLSQQASEGKDK